MEKKEFKQKTAHELETLLANESSELHALRVRASEGQLKKVREIRVRRKNIARILTAQNAMKSTE